MDRGSDPHWANVVLLLDASDQNNLAKPAGLDLKGHSATWTLDARCVEGAVWKFGRSCIRSDNGGKSRIVFADSADWDMEGGDFTIEMWARPSSSPAWARTGMVGRATTDGGNTPIQLSHDSGNRAGARVRDSSSEYGGQSPSSSFGTNVWRHVAMVRFGQYLYCYVSGVRTQVSSALSGKTLMDSSGPLVIGKTEDDSTSGTGYKGYLDQVRITKGVARYTAASIRIPSAPFPHG